MDRKHILIGLAAGTGLVLLYFAILLIANSAEHAIQQFMQMWYWIIILAAGFGAQAALYSFMRTSIKNSPATIAASGGMSTASMVACCAHHLSDVLPILGLSAASIFLVKYQTQLIIIGVLSNIVGLSIMLATLQKHKMIENSRLNKINLETARNIAMIASAVIVLILFIYKLFI